MGMCIPNHAPNPKAELPIEGWDRTAVRVSVVLFGIAVWVGAICILLKEPDKPDTDIEPASEYIQFKISEETKSLLSSEVRDLLAKMESGQVSGHFENEFRSTLKQATFVENFDRRWRTYHFALGKNKIEELDPIITVVVQRRTGRIIRCSVWTCCS